MLQYKSKLFEVKYAFILQFFAKRQNSIYFGNNCIDNHLCILYIYYIDTYQCIGDIIMNEIDVALICKVLGDSNRLQIVKMLSEGELCGCKILEKFDITQPTLSHHMKALCECGLVVTRKEGKWSHYSLNRETLFTFNAFISSLSYKKGDC